MHRSGLKYEHVVAFALEHPWAVTPSVRAVIVGILARRMAGEEPDDTEIARALVARANRGNGVDTATAGGVAVIPIYGVIAPRMNMFTEMSGGTTFEELTAQTTAAADDSNVKAILFDVDSPGGNVAGATEFSRTVLAARAKKPVIAQANHMICSAAYWAVAGATEIVASPSAIVGSIGVYAIHNDISDALGQMGIKRTVFSAGKYKAEGADGGPLSEDAQGHVQGLIDHAYARFVGDVAKGRGTSTELVRNGYGEGRALNVEAALAANMIDRVATFGETLARLLPASTTTGARATLTPAVTPQEPPTAATGQEPRQEATLGAFQHRLLQIERNALR